MNVFDNKLSCMKNIALIALNLALTILFCFLLGLAMPLSRPMPSVGKGVEELRLKDRSGIYRVFYIARLAHAVLVFHALQKKTQQTPKHEIDIGQRRLKELLNEK